VRSVIGETIIYDPFIMTCLIFRGEIGDNFFSVSYMKEYVKEDFTLSYTYLIEWIYEFNNESIKVCEVLAKFRHDARYITILDFKIHDKDKFDEMISHLVLD